jgi:hypothetical protein
MQPTFQFIHWKENSLSPAALLCGEDAKTIPDPEWEEFAFEPTVFRPPMSGV